MRSPLHSPRLRRIVAGYTINRLGTWFGYVALAVVVFDQTRSALAVAALLVAGQVVSAFLAPALVARTEASSRGRELSGLYLFEAVTTAILAALVLWRFSLPAVLFLVAIDGTAALASSALLRAAAARCARQWGYEQHDRSASEASTETAREARALDAERAANAALNVGFATTFTLGPALAGIIVPALGASTALFLDAASFLICGALLLDVKPQLEDAQTPSVRARLRAAWDHINGAPMLRHVLLAEAFALTFFTFSGPVEVAYAKSSLHAGASGYGVLLGTWGFGVAVGSVVFARSGKRSPSLLLTTSTLAVGVAYLGWSAAPSLALACPAGLIGGIGNGVQWAALISAVQMMTPQSLHGRLMGAVESIGAICPALGFSLAGAIVVLSSPRIAFLVAGIGAAIGAVPFTRARIRPVTGALPPSSAGTETDSPHASVA